jgi:hypothetical protein
MPLEMWRCASMCRRMLYSASAAFAKAWMRVRLNFPSFRSSQNPFWSVYYDHVSFRFCVSMHDIICTHLHRREVHIVVADLEVSPEKHYQTIQIWSNRRACLVFSSHEPHKHIEKCPCFWKEKVSRDNALARWATRTVVYHADIFLNARAFDIEGPK